jgi:hypothetical protein
MADYRRFDSSSTTANHGVRVTGIERRTAGTTELIEVKFFRSSKNERYKDVEHVASFRANDKRFGYVLDRLQKGDRVTIRGPVHNRAYLPKDVKPSSLKTAEDVAKAIRIVAEIPFPEEIVCHEDLRQRTPGGGEIEDDSLGGGKEEAADEPAGGEGFFGDE